MLQLNVIGPHIPLSLHLRARRSRGAFLQEDAYEKCLELPGLASDGAAMRTKPDKRIIVERIANNQNRRLLSELPARALREQLAERVRYEGSGAHKSDPYSWGLEPYRGRRRDRTYCDLHAKFSLEDRVRIPILLKRGVLAGLIGDHSLKGDPSMLWTVDESGWIYELRITSPGTALYHGYPVLPSDPIARSVIARLAAWTSDGTEDTIEDPQIVEAALQAAERRYV